MGKRIHALCMGLMVLVCGGGALIAHANTISANQPFLADGCSGNDGSIKSFLVKDRVLARLNHFLVITYKTALSLEKSNAAKSQIKRDQCAWQAKAAACKNADCLKKYFKARIQELSKSNISKTDHLTGRNPCPELPFMTNEADKEFCIRRLTSRYSYVLRGGDYMKSPMQASLCNNMFAALIRGNNNIHYVESVAHAANYQDAKIARYRACNEYQGYRDGNTFVLFNNCRDFRLYHLPLLTKKSRAFMYWLEEHGCGGRVPHDLVSINFKSCQVHQRYPLIPSKSMGFNGLIEYHSRYYLLEVSSRVSIRLVYYDVNKGVFSGTECDWVNEPLLKKLLKKK